MTASPQPTAVGGEIELQQLTKRFGDVLAVDAIDLSIPRGTFFSMLGPSGCGKTTTLRMIAGFEQPTSGSLQLDGRDLASTPAQRRNVNTVVQNYALFPHLDVYDNIAYGLRRHGVDKHELRRRVGESLELVQLTGYESRSPAKLSGGQRQRVALARALVLRPSVLLLDEPLGALDARLRKQLQVELKALQQQVGITFVYVTHDQEEALTMSDLVAVMAGGRIEQVAPPWTVYEEPASAFVAEFLGVSNLMSAVALGSDAKQRCRVTVGGVELLADHGATGATGPVRIMIRPERVRLEAPGGGGANRLSGIVDRTVYLGNATQLQVRVVTGDTVQALVQNDGNPLPFRQGDAVDVQLPAEALRVLVGESAPAKPD